MPAQIRCHYEVLGVERSADAATIKKAHRKLALRLHPDKNIGDDSAAEQFRLVQQAYVEDLACGTGTPFSVVDSLGSSVSTLADTSASVIRPSENGMTNTERRF